MLFADHNEGWCSMFESRSFNRGLRSVWFRLQADAARLADIVKRPEVASREGFDAYRALGSHSRISDEVLKQRYHRIVREIHPDRLQALGASMGMIRKAEFVLAEINQAYATISRKRGLK